MSLNRVFYAIDSEQFESCFIDWVTSIANISKGQIIAIDGKTIRDAKSHGKKSQIHMASAWTCENNLVLDQVKTAEKSNEIRAILELLDLLNIAGNTISIDAMGTQKEIAEKIIDKNADYILAVKANQLQLLAHIEDEFKFSRQPEIYTKHDLDYGHIETRICSVITDFKFIEQGNP